ncbi:MAG: hypothetical protein EOP84_07415 [Verrucomicrobiaceae bacterium]|nr:MAG: hypothetical protein EOP84_07415 [Verrucomicrobiaceae bacterium]
MNDHELRARLRSLREPAVDEDAAATALRRSLSALEEDSRERLSAPAAASPWTWRDWLWPSPLAWAALVTIWVGITTVERSAAPEPQNHRMLAGEAAPERVEPYSLLLAHQEYRELLRKYQQTTEIK